MAENTFTHKKIIKTNGQFPLLKDDSILRDVIDAKEKFNFGTVVVVDKNNKLVGIVTDGDLRRIITSSQKHYSALMVEDIKSFMNKNPISIKESLVSIDKLKKIFKKNKILDIVILNNQNQVIGIIHIHDII